MNVGVILPNLGVNQLAWNAINQCNMFSRQLDNSYYLFYQDVFPPCVRPLVSYMNVSQAWSFEGILIATTIDTAMATAQTLMSNEKIFYIWDLEWIRPHKNDFLYNMNVFRDPRLKLVARSDDHAKAIKNYCNRQPDAIVPAFVIPEILKQVT